MAERISPAWTARAWAVALALVCLLGLGVRLVDLTDPPLDFHATRQLRSAIIARSVFYRLESGADPAVVEKAANLAKLEEYEPPLLETLAGFIDHLLGAENFWVGRALNSLFWVLGGLALAAFARRFAGPAAVLAGLCFYLFLPFSVTASRSFQPDPWMVTWILFAALALYRWMEAPSWKWALAAGLLSGMAVLVKAFAVFFIAGLWVGAVLGGRGWRQLLRSAQPWVIGLLAAAPALLVYLVSNPERSGSFFSFWVVSLSGLIRTSGFYADWLAMLKGLMGLVTVATALLGALLAERKARALLTGLWAGYALFGLVFPYQYITHEYYHLALIPLAALSLVPLLDLVFQRLKSEALFWRLAAAGVVAFAAFYGLYVSRSSLVAASYANEPASWAAVGAALPEDRTFIALTGDYGMRLNYYGWRSTSAAWPSAADDRLSSLAGNAGQDFETSFQERTAGKDLFLVTALSEFDAQPELKQKLTGGYPLLVEGNGFLIFDLTRPLAEAKP